MTHRNSPEFSIMSAWHSLEGKIIWVTGGAGHLGSPITAELDRAGAKVVCFDLPGRAEALVDERKLGHTIPSSLDITDVENMPAAIDATIAKLGLPDGLVYLPTASSRGRTLETLTAGEFQRTFDRGLTPTFVFCRTVAERMRPRRNVTRRKDGAPAEGLPDSTIPPAAAPAASSAAEATP